ncbi:MAG TPA: rhomboid family intramembrane serine protease, partial [Thermoanaerobaculia bacterium]|nr:rhomboid family intramembrane serine protease [Thermoanaerobaculia bacterium]
MSGMTEEAPRRTIEVRPQPPSLRRALVSALLTCLILLVLLVTYLAGDVERTGSSIVWVLVLGVPLLLLLGGLLFQYERQKKPPGLLTLTGDAVLWQQPPPGKDVVIPYEEIRSVEERQGLIVLGQEAGQGLVLPESWFPEPGLAGSVAADLRARIRDLPDGEAILARIGENRARGESFASSGRAATISVAAVLAGIFLLQMFLGASESTFSLLAFGANSSVLVRDGEWFRLATGNLLHAGLFHLAVNLMSLLALGRILEPLLGKARFLVIFLGSALAGAAGSALVGNHLLSVGASTGIAGLIGALGVAEQRWPDFFGRRPSWKIWLSLVFFWTLLPGSIFPNIDNHAHVAGFLAGLLLALACTEPGDPLPLRGRHRPLFNLLAALLVGLFAVAGAVVVRHWGDPGRDLEAAARLLDAPETPPELVNEAAWLLAASPDAGRPRLEKALAAMERLLAEKPASPAEYLDTQATLHYRLGSLAEAVFVERKALAREDSPVYASQLARFEWEYGNFQGGPFRPGAPLPVLTVLPDGALSVDLRGNRLPDRTLLRFVLGNGEGA